MALARQISLVVGLLALGGCQGKLFSIHVVEEAETVVAGASLLEDLVGDLGFGEFVSMDVTDSEELRNQGVEPGDIKEVLLVEFTLAAIDPVDADLSWISEMDVVVEAPGLPAVTIASQDTFPAGEATVAFELPDVDLTEYVVSESLTITTDVSAQRPPEDTRVKATFDLRIGVTAQGVGNNI